MTERSGGGNGLNKPRVPRKVGVIPFIDGNLCERCGWSANARVAQSDGGSKDVRPLDASCGYRLPKAEGQARIVRDNCRAAAAHVECTGECMLGGSLLGAVCRLGGRRSAADVGRGGGTGIGPGIECGPWLVTAYRQRLQQQ